MKLQVPESLSRIDDSGLLLDAVYYVVRVLRNSRRGYEKTLVSTEPPPKVRRLAELAIQEIEAADKSKIPAMKDARINNYIVALEALLASKSPAEDDAQSRDAERILAEMRAK